MGRTDPAPVCACDEIAERLLDFVEGDLSADESDQFEGQIRGCGYCTELLRAYTAVGGLVRAGGAGTCAAVVFRAAHFQEDQEGDGSAPPR